jgi:hypothetical protein
VLVSVIVDLVGYLMSSRLTIVQKFGPMARTGILLLSQAPLLNEVGCLHEYSGSVRQQGILLHDERWRQLLKSR